ncbi:TonB-dependent receptor [Pedobacter sp. L105]|uniref:TonB-dependent receptor n=1 Tax=Pedobacter sp. L105 TaxID=1641871 RepID=UPI00131BAC1C|nr:TonB-dependent receptor [Pedobacter sp. L105]
MKGIFILVLALTGSLKVCAQASTSNKTVIPVIHKVSGLLTDAAGSPVPGASVILHSSQDSISGMTNEDGIFVFSTVKSSVFSLSILAIGYKAAVRKYLFNDSQVKLILDPVILGEDVGMLKEVKINGTPTIKYKTDTVEYRAADYKIRENANINELLKKMEGFEVGSDNSVSYLGKKLDNAKLNGKEYAGGDVALAIKNLPADIVEKIQVIDDYGFQAAKTGVKTEDSKKVLNITTKPDRSVGTILRPTAGAGGDSRYDEQLFAQHINGNEQLGLIGSFNQSINGVSDNNALVSISSAAIDNSSANFSAPNGGTTKTGVASLNYRDDWGEHVQVNANYNLNTTNVNLVNNSSGALFFNTADAGNYALSTLFTRNAEGYSKQTQHVLDLDLEWSPDKSNLLKISPSLKYDKSLNMNNFTYDQTGLINQNSKGSQADKSTIPATHTLVFYQHVFDKPGRNISVQMEVLGNNKNQQSNSNSTFITKDSLQNLVSDSTIRRVIDRRTTTRNYKTSLTYTEPISPVSRINLTAQVNAKQFNDIMTTNNVAANQTSGRIDSLSNNYRYSFNDYRFGLNYDLVKKKFALNVGILVNPSTLKESGVNQDGLLKRNFIYLLPVFRVQYNWSLEQGMQLNYSGMQNEPAGYQIQPVPDYSSPQNPIIGNPLLKPFVRHTVQLSYQNYIPNDKINLAGELSSVFYHNQIVPNSVLEYSPDLKSYITETRFVNTDGTYSFLGNYSVTKQLENRSYSLALNGWVAKDHTLTFNNNDLNVVSNWRFYEKLGPRISPNDIIEINPFVSYELDKSKNSLPAAIDTKFTILKLGIEGQVHLLSDRTLTLGYNANKNYINGITSALSNNPLVINAFLEQQLFKKRNGILKLAVFDLFNQNKFISRVISANGYTDTNSNRLSRYLMLSFSLNLQKWNGTAKKRGKELKRRGDGSFY